MIPDRLFADQIAACVGKVAFITAARAHLTAKRMVRQKKPVSPYRCKWCGFYHLGSTFIRKEQL